MLRTRTLAQAYLPSCSRLKIWAPPHSFAHPIVSRAVSTTPAVLRVPLWRQLFRTVRSKWSRKPPRLVGTDEAGNRYFEAPPNEASEHTHRATNPMRFVLRPGQESVEEHWAQAGDDLPVVPSEWQSWLRYRRKEPPTEEEIARNAASVQHRLAMAEKLEAKHEQERAQMVRDGLLRETTRATGVKSQLSGAPKVPFPVHEAFEVAPGEGSAAGGDGKPTQQ